MYKGPIQENAIKLKYSDLNLPNLEVTDQKCFA